MVLDLKDVYLTSWNIFKKSWWQYIIVTLILMACMFVPYVGSILQFFMMLLVLNAALKAVKGEDISFSSFFDFKKVFTVKSIIFVVIFAVYSFIMQMGVDSVVISLILAVIGIAISIIFYPIMCVIIDKDLNVKDTILHAATLTKGVRFEIVIVMILNLFIGFLGVLLLIIGVFVALPVIIATTAVVYSVLEKKNSAPVTTAE
ncbi:hypothetical protein [Candidatus Ruminimicrobium bovinum]|uniref:hypothetical protein n=1 Tax=Candidatus Ruminimicrobium bovinum TaxID=3242779 RepID=UPI0039B82D90